MKLYPDPEDPTEVGEVPPATLNVQSEAGLRQIAQSLNLLIKQFNLLVRILQDTTTGLAAIEARLAAVEAAYIGAGSFQDSDSIHFSAVDQTVSAIVLPLGVDHNSLANYVSQEHIDWTNASADLSTTGHISNSGDWPVSSHYFGAGDDAYISYDGTNLVVNPRAQGNGLLSVQGNIGILSDTDGIYFGQDADASISFDGSHLQVRTNLTSDGFLILAGNMFIEGRQNISIYNALLTPVTDIGQDAIAMSNSNATNGNWLGMSFRDSTLNYAAWLGCKLANHTFHYGELHFYTRQSDGLLPRIVISNNVQVYTKLGIGVTAANPLHVASSSARQIRIAYNAANYAEWVVGSSGDLQFFLTGHTISWDDSATGLTQTFRLWNNESTNPASSARLQILTQGGGAGDPHVVMGINGVQAWSIGVDNSDSDALKIGHASTVGTNTDVTISTTGAVTFASTIQAAGYKASDGTPGGTDTDHFAFKNGLYLSGSLSTWEGSTNLTTLGTVTTGTWNASLISLENGGTNANLTATNGAIVYCDASGFALLSPGTSGQVLKTNGDGAAPSWVNAATNPMTTQGDIIYGGASGEMTRLAPGTAGYVLQTNGSGAAPSWVAISGGANLRAVSDGPDACKILRSDGSTICASFDTTNKRMVVGAGGSPTYTLQVVGDIYTTTTVRTAKIQPTSDGTTALLVKNAADTLAILVVDSTNIRVGIGRNPSYALDVGGDIACTGAIRPAAVILPAY